MNDKFIPEEQMLRYFDGELEGEEKAAFEALLADSPELQQSLEALSLSKYAVNRLGIMQQVGAVHAEYKAGKKTVPAPVRRTRWVRYAWAAAAAAVIVLALFMFLPSTGGNKNTQGLYASVYKPYDNTQVRSGATEPLEKAYQARNFKQVTETYTTLANPGAKEKLLAACAYMETNQTETAKKLLISLQQDNRARQTTEFADDAEYYLALCYLKLNNMNEAGALFKKINGNPAHLYADKINDQFMQQFGKIKK